MPRFSSHFTFHYLFGSHLPRQIHTCPQLPTYLHPACLSAAMPTWAPPQPTRSGAPILAYILAHLPRCLRTPPAQEPPASLPPPPHLLLPAGQKAGQAEHPHLCRAAAALCPRRPPPGALSDRLPPAPRCPAGNRGPWAAPGPGRGRLPPPGQPLAARARFPAAPRPLTLLRPRAHFLGNTHLPNTLPGHLPTSPAKCCLPSARPRSSPYPDPLPLPPTCLGSLPKSGLFSSHCTPAWPPLWHPPSLLACPPLLPLSLLFPVPTYTLSLSWTSRLPVPHKHCPSPEQLTPLLAVPPGGGTACPPHLCSLPRRPCSTPTCATLESRLGRAAKQRAQGG